MRRILHRSPGRPHEDDTMAESKLPAWIQDHLSRYIATNGEDGYWWDATQGGGTGKVPTLLLTTTGRKSGQQRTSALSYLREGNRLLVLGSNFGQEHHPGWSSNLLAEPDATVAISGAEIPVTATLLSGDERERGIQRFLAYPMYQAYRTRTDRELRLFALARR